MFADYIANETLASKAEWNAGISGAFEVEADDTTWRVKIEKA